MFLQQNLNSKRILLSAVTHHVYCKVKALIESHTLSSHRKKSYKNKSLNIFQSFSIFSKIYVFHLYLYNTSSYILPSPIRNSEHIIKLQLSLFLCFWFFLSLSFFPGNNQRNRTSKLDHHPSCKSKSLVVDSDMSLLVNGKALTSLLTALTIIAVMVVVDARFVVEKESIRVLNPEEMRSKHDGSIANFGLPDYGGFLIGAVVYPDSKTDGCSAFGKTFKPKFPRPTILLLDRGGNNTTTTTTKTSQKSKHVFCLFWINKKKNMSLF